MDQSSLPGGIGGASSASRDAWRDVRKMMHDLEQQVLEKGMDCQALQRSVDARAADARAAKAESEQMRDETMRVIEATRAARDAAGRLDEQLDAAALESRQLAQQLQLVQALETDATKRLQETKDRLARSAAEHESYLSGSQDAALAELERMAQRVAARGGPGGGAAGEGGGQGEAGWELGRSALPAAWLQEQAKQEAAEAAAQEEAGAAYGASEHGGGL